MRLTADFSRGMSMKYFAMATALLLLAVPAFAADVDGKWTGSVSTPGGDFPVNFTFKAEGAVLTGSMAGFDGSDIQIKDGKVDGNTISFNITLDFGGMPLTLSYKGVVSPDEIKFSGDAGGLPFEFVVKKVQ
jgi:hypothetical protein